MFISVLLAGMLGAKIFSVLEAWAGQGAHSAAKLLGLTALCGSEGYSGACQRSGFWRAATMRQS
jgi:hypothetical protein